MENMEKEYEMFRRTMSLSSKEERDEKRSHDLVWDLSRYYFGYVPYFARFEICGQGSPYYRFVNWGPIAEIPRDLWKNLWEKGVAVEEAIEAEEDSFGNLLYRGQVVYLVPEGEHPEEWGKLLEGWG